MWKVIGRGFVTVCCLVMLFTGSIPRGAAWAVAPHSTNEELRVETDDGMSLAGTLHLPPGGGPHPAVIFTHGSEPGQRSQRGYLRWAEPFRIHGFAVLVFDKRGAGDSEGEYVEAPDLAVPARDLLAWVAALKKRSDIRRNRIGVLGWSQGGWVGPLAAGGSPDIAFVISISGPGVSPLEQNIFDKTNQFRASGATEAQVEEFSRVIRLVWTYHAKGVGRAEAQRAWDAASRQPWFPERIDGPPMMDRDIVLKDSRMAHYVAHSTYDPAPVLETVRVPMLALFGEHDTAVPVEPSIAAMEAAFERGGNRDFTWKIVPGAGHGISITAPIEADDTTALTVGEFVVDWAMHHADDRSTHP